MINLFRSKRASVSADLDQFNSEAPMGSFISYTEWDNGQGATFNFYSETLGDRLVNLSWIEFEAMYDMWQLTMKYDAEQNEK